MLNSAPIALAPSMAGLVVGPGGAPPATDGPASFAQALDQASAGQRDAVDGSAAEPPAGENPPTRPTAADAQRARGARHGMARDAARLDAAALGVAPARQAAQAETMSGPKRPPADAALDTQDHAGQAPIDLAALLPGLTLQRAAANDTDGAQAPHRTQHRDEAGVARGAATTPRAALARDPVAGLDIGGTTAARAMQGADMPASMPATGAGAGAHPTSAHGLRAQVAASAEVAAATIEARGTGAEAALQGDTAARQAARPEAAVDAGPMTSTALPVAAAAAVPQRSSAAAAPFQAELTAAMASSDFAPALGARLSVLVRDGIEHAQLKLNPAEMGPIEVRIALDGHQAQVDFSAAHASTRQALQDAVPALASALRESGLTLTGGGVFEQPREQRGEPRPDTPRGTAPSNEAARNDPSLGTGPLRMPRARGVVDLYA